MTTRVLLLAAASALLLGELALRRFAPRSRFYASWKAAFERVGEAWTAVLLGLVYFLSIGPVSLLQRLFGADLLDRPFEPRPSFWHAHEPNPLGPLRAARHQF